MVKRLIDIFFGLVGFLFFLIIFPFVSVLILIDDGLPVLIKLNRVSQGKIFKMYKFRTMVKNAEELKPSLKNLNERDEPYFKIKNDPRITKVGKILRKFRLDEVPQFINVLKGDIAIVGPRPHDPEEVLNYPLEFKELILAKAGVTGLAQVYNTSKDFLPALEEMKLDMYYLKHQSLILDLKIIFKTILIFLFKANGY